MLGKKQKSSILPAKTPSKSVLKIAAQNVAQKTAEIKEKVKAKQLSKTKTKQPSSKKVTATKKATTSKKSKGGKNTVTSNRLKLLVTIVNRNKAEYYTDLIQSFDVNMQCVMLGQGTADKSTLGLLGLTDSDKAVILSVIQEQKISDAFHTLETKFDTIKGGKGVAWTLPLTSVIGALIYGFLSNNRETVKEANNGQQ